MKEHLARLRTDHAAGRELPQSAVDGKFLDLLVASANARNPSLRLSLQSIDMESLRRSGASALQAVSGLAVELVNGMKHGDWHAVLDIDGQHVAVSARHDPKHPERVSLAVMNSLGSGVESAEWLKIAEALCAHANRALVKAGKAPQAQVWLNCLNSSLLQTSTGSGSEIFALAAVAKMPADGGLVVMHRRVLDQQSRTQSPTAARTVDANDVLGAPLFKLMTRRHAMDDLLSARPELQQAKVNKKGQTLDEYQAAHEAPRTPPFGMTSRYNTAYEEKRIHMYERAVKHLKSRLGPQLDDMKAHLGNLRLNLEGQADLPPARDAEFLGMLIDAENARDPSLRLSAHRLDPAQLAAGDPAATESLWSSITEGKRTGKDWNATLDINGHHVAVSARHDAGNPEHVSLVVAEGAGSPMSSEDWKLLVKQLHDRMQAQPADTPAGAGGKLWVTHLDLSARQPETNSALFALMAAKDMGGDPGIAEVHADALAQANSRPEPAAMRGRNGDHLLDPDYGLPGADDPMTSLDMVALQVEMYEEAVGHYELALGKWGTATVPAPTPQGSGKTASVQTPRIVPVPGPANLAPSSPAEVPGMVAGKTTPPVAAVAAKTAARVAAPVPDRIPPTVPRGVRLPELPEPVLADNGAVDVQATGRAQIQALLPAVATLIGSGRDHATVLAELQAMPDAAMYATLERHAADSFMAYAQHGGAAPDLATAAAALEQIRYAGMDTALPDAAQGAGLKGASAFHGELMAQEREGGLSARDVETRFEHGRARGTGNVCMFDTLYQLADRAGHGAQLRPFTPGAQGEAARAAFGDRMQELLAQTGLLARTANGGYDQFEFENGSLATDLLAQVTGLQLVVLNQTDDGVMLNPAAGTAGPEAFILRTRTAGNDGHFEPLWPRG